MDTNYSAFTSSSSSVATSSAAYAARIVGRLFQNSEHAMAVRLWNGEVITVGNGTPAFTIGFNDALAFRELCLSRDPLSLVHAYFSGALDVEGDFYKALALEDSLKAIRLTRNEKLHTLFDLLHIRADKSVNHGATGVASKRLSVRRSNCSHTIAFHYDVSNEFYRLWLDERMVYSCGYFKTATDSLDLAQANKLDHICRKLRLKKGERLLDIGCGWGALAVWAAQHYGVTVTGITLSHRQHKYAQKLVRDLNLQDQVKILFLDYRDLAEVESFDKVSSVGMFEHVGLANLGRYFSTVHRVLKPGGLFLNHGITHDEEGWQKTTSTTFINRYVFPDGELDTVSNVQREMERSQFEIWDVEGLRPHYALTLRAWVARLEATREAALKIVDESTWRVWRLYMAASARHFELGDIGVYQILAGKRASNSVPVPLTRDGIYTTR